MFNNLRVASVYSVDGGGGSVPDWEERFANSPDLAPEGGSGFGSYFGLLFGVCVVEDAWADGEKRGLGR